jgi:hypothetical protein
MKISEKTICNEIIVSLSITKFECSPSEITRILGIMPSKTWKKSDLIDKRALIKYKENGWRVSSSLSKNENLKTHIEDLLQIIIPHKAKFRNLPSFCCIELSCCIYVYHEVPEISFSVSTVKLLSELQAEIDVDLYYLADDEARVGWVEE